MNFPGAAKFAEESLESPTFHDLWFGLLSVPETYMQQVTPRGCNSAEAARVRSTWKNPLRRYGARCLALERDMFGKCSALVFFCAWVFRAREEDAQPIPGSKIRNPVRIRIRDINRISNLVRILIFHGYRIFLEYNGNCLEITAGFEMYPKFVWGSGIRSSWNSEQISSTSAQKTAK